MALNRAKERGVSAQELLAIRTWLRSAETDSTSRLTRQQRKALQRFERALARKRRTSTDEFLQAKMSVGITQFLLKVDKHPRAITPENCVLALCAAALSALVGDDDLPDDFLSRLAGMSSRRIALVVASARQAEKLEGSRERMLWNALQHREARLGSARLLTVLASPEHGGVALSGMLVANAKSGVNSRMDLIKVALAGAGGAAISGVVGNRVDSLAVKAWEWVDAPDEEVGTSRGDQGASVEIDQGGGGVEPPSLIDHLHSIWE